nr:glucuronate isomerase [Tardiphaga robiniae]
MNVHAAIDLKWPGLKHPNGDPLRLNHGDFVAIDRHKDTTYEATYRPQALYSRANEGFHANNETFLLHEVATNLPIYREDTGPTDFHLHLPPGGFQLVLVTSGMFTFDYDGRFYNVGPGAVMLQSAIVHRQLFYTWSGLSTEENLKTPQTVVPDPLSMGYSGKFLEAFVTDPTTFPNPTIVGPDQINEAETPRVAWTLLCMIAPTMQASGFRIRWRWMRSSSCWLMTPSSRRRPSMCAILASRLRAVILSPVTSSQPIRMASPSCRRAPRRPWMPPLSRKVRLSSIASFAARPNSGIVPERRSNLRPVTW